jgi:hypothetical protein
MLVVFECWSVGVLGCVLEMMKDTEAELGGEAQASLTMALAPPKLSQDKGRRLTQQWSHHLQ